MSITFINAYKIDSVLKHRMGYVGKERHQSYFSVKKSSRTLWREPERPPVPSHNSFIRLAVSRGKGHS